MFIFQLVHDVTEFASSLRPVLCDKFRPPHRAAAHNDLSQNGKEEKNMKQKEPYLQQEKENYI